MGLFIAGNGGFVGVCGVSWQLALGVSGGFGKSGLGWVTVAMRGGSAMVLGDLSMEIWAGLKASVRGGSLSILVAIPGQRALNSTIDS
ncbi:hypothetical protein TIFTF001_036929 [Ficus carica]|uniref:Uncharacterized protein n=1 Tax=Ficus carica TaxID=3494 RepID=A0AA88E4B3_FICCA|nr:hypothetical protein TIFTF001_036917 [Ficus carica]GMN67860.1 hypothetical protein TIFTF001_036920 [Ficus carica]GMN67866.1 hypothetical protein TIFTF001_036926 [Ficus carica]GMN67869.1 hypothetical protein TIFTF001_036929 [Ficus carica]